MKVNKFFTGVLICIVLISIPVNPVHAPVETFETPSSEITLPEPEITPQAILERSEPIVELFEITAYDLSVQSCGKSESHPEYGITASGLNIANKEWPSTRVVAVDPKVIPLGTHVAIEFVESEYSKYNGIYTAVDTGSAIKGNKLDLFLGENTYDECMQFGRTEAYVSILNN